MDIKKKIRYKPEVAVLSSEIIEHKANCQTERSASKKKIGEHTLELLLEQNKLLFIEISDLKKRVEKLKVKLKKLKVKTA